MGLFDSVLKDNESLFLDTLPLDIDFIPPILEGRENEQQYIATCIQPLFSKRNGKNLLIMGAPGIGKTVATKHVLDEVDKITDEQIFYHLLEEINRRTLVLITNNEQWLTTLDARVRSRLTPDLLVFKPYNFEETKMILKKRVEFAFAPNVLDPVAFEKIVEKAYDAKGIRAGLYLLKEAGEIAEQNAQRKISLNL